MFEIPENSNYLVDIVGWQARYDLWSLEPNEHLDAITWNVEPAALKTLFEDATNGLPGWRKWTGFRFPVAIADDLQAVIVLNSVVRLSPGLAQVWYNTLDVFGRLPSHREPVVDASFQLKLWGSGRVVAVFRRTLGYSYSPCGELVHGGLLQFLHDVNFATGHPRPSYGCFESWHLQVVSAYTASFLDRATVFHPRLPLVAFHALIPSRTPCSGRLDPGPVKTYLWHFGGSLNDSKHLTNLPVRNLYVIHDGLLDSLGFISDGEYIHGEDSKTGDPVVIKLDDFLKEKEQQRQPRTIQDNDDRQVRLPVRSNTALQQQARKRTFEHLVSLCKRDRPKNAVKHTDSLTFGRNRDGVAQISKLTQLDEGAIVLQTLGADGKLHLQTLSRLPDKIRSSSVASVLNTAAAGRREGYSRILLNKGAQERYSLDDVGDLSLPAIVERSETSVPTYTSDGSNHNNIFLLEAQDTGEEQAPSLKRRKTTCISWTMS
ncbi:hypothetical protein VTN96DRAFT_7550 [Rasamsonia emersonii]